MMSDSLKVLLIEDNPGDVRLIREMLREVVPARIDLNCVENLSDGLRLLRVDEYEVVLLDLGLPESRGSETYHRLRQAAPNIPVVVLTGLDEEGVLAAELLRAGAQDYLVKGHVDSRLLARSLRYAVERGRIERQLRERADELADAARRKDEFLAVLAHELRNPLAPIAMALGLLRRGDVSDSQREWSYDMMERQVRHMSRLIDDLLDVSRITRGQIVLQTEQVNIAEVVRRAIESARPFIDEREHELIMNVPASSKGVTIEADPVRLEQVIVNLLTNAAKFTEPGGRINVAVEADDQRAVIRVHDTGHGIPEDMLESIFDLFAQADCSTSRRSQWGLGIGLSLVRGLIELHGGSVKAHSDGPGQGSEFIVTLPINRTSQSTGPAGASHGTGGAAEWGRPRRVLVVDDHPEFSRCMAQLFTAWGHDARVANSGAEALNAARSLRPEIVLLDIAMPGMDGYEVVQRLRAMPEARDALVVAVTGYGRSQDQQRSVEAGFDKHLVKPLSPEALQDVLIARRSLDQQPRGVAAKEPVSRHGGGT